MPELPEVETIRLGLSKKIVNKAIKEIVIYNLKSFRGNKFDALKQKVLRVERRGKIIRIQLTNNQNILFHLKMTGQLIYINKDTRVAGGHPSHDWHNKLPNKHTRITFLFDDKASLYFNDLRKFGWCKLVSNNEVDKFFSQLGPEPFSKEFNLKYLLEKSQRFPSRKIKQFLMDQTIIAGVGNIYNDEALYISKIHPGTRVNKLTLKEWRKIMTNIKFVLKEGINYGGTTDRDYVNSDGKSGGMQDHLNVYHKTGNNCRNNCGGIITRIKIGQRGTYYCPTCQKESI